MWTNVFRLGEFQVVSWFQFLPSESDPTTLNEKGSKVEQKDFATCTVLSAHLKLQNNGFLSTWTNSFVGPWDPSQGVHNPDEKIKLWLFLPGRHSSIVETAQAAVSKLRVLGRGVWLAPGDSEEVAVALSQALRNSIERALKGLSYVRFGDVFAKGHSSAANGKSLRNVQPTCEFIFAATEDAIYIHVIISAKHIRNLNDDDIERVLKRSSSNFIKKGLPVIVSPNGMRGRLTGCCPSDLVKQLYTSKVKANNESALGLPSIARSSGCHLRGQSCFVEVTLGCPSPSCKDTQGKKCSQEINATKPNSEEPFLVASGKCQQSDFFPILERTFIYPIESVVVPVLHRAFARSSLKRFFLQNWTGTSLYELWPFWNFPCSSQFLHCQFLAALGIDLNGTGLKRKYNCSSNSSCSSTSSTGSTSSGSDHGAGIITGDLEADADSLTSRQSGLSANDQFDNNGKKMVSKRLRSSVTDIFGQVATVTSATEQNAVKSEFSVADANNSASGGLTNVQVGLSWGWDDEDRGIGIDIQALLSEFGDFGDFFENDILNFGEPPGTAESQAIVFPSIDCGDASDSPCTIGLDSPDQKAAGLTSFENFNQLPSTFSDDTQSNLLNTSKDVKSSVSLAHSLISSDGKFDKLTKAEAILMFSPEYAAVETFSNDFCSSIFRNPYLPGSKRVESSPVTSLTCVYGAMPPSPLMSDMDENLEKSSKLSPGTGLYIASTSGQLGKLYTLVHSATKKINSKLFNDLMPSFKGQKSSSVSVMNSAKGASALQRNYDNTFEAGHFLLSLETLLATDVECIIFQVAMCRIRHTLLSFYHRDLIGLNKVIGDAMLDPISYDTSSLPDVITIKHEGKKIDTLPVRIAGDIHSGMLDSPLTTSVGVWRPIGVPKGAKPSNTCLSQNSSYVHHNSSNDEIFGFHGQRMPLQELLDAIGLLVQQATSLVDVSLDMDVADGSYSWLALEEQHRRGFSCGPSMVHAGCGGMFASCHYLDIAGVELIDPLSANVQVSNIISLLQSDIKLGLKNAFPSSEGPLSLTEWCRGRQQSGDSGTSGDNYPFQFVIGESKDSLTTVSLGGEPISPPQSGGASSSIREGVRMDDSTQRRLNQDFCGSETDAQKLISRFKPTLAILPLPALLVGYQDDWLKTSVNCLQLWEKAPLEPYALPKSVSYFVVCPDVDLLTAAGADFFQQLGAVYEACKLGSHTQANGSLLESSSVKLLPSGFLLVNCPQELKGASNNMLSISAITDYFSILSKCWNVKGYLNAVKLTLKDLKLTANPSANHKERSVGPCMVVYVVCPFLEPMAVLQTVIECSAALGSCVLASDKEEQCLLYNQVAKALVNSAVADEASASNVVMLSGFRIPKLVLQIVTIDSLLRLNKSSKELSMYKEIAFTVYNKIRRIPRPSSGADNCQSSAISIRPQSALIHAASPLPGIWKDCLAPRISGSALTRESELDSSLRPVSWDNSWQTTRIGGLNSEPVRPMELFLLDDPRYVFEPLFILAETGYSEHGIFPAVLHNNMPESSNSKSSIEDNSSLYTQSTGGAADLGKGSPLDGSEHDIRVTNLHCSYGWTEDWRWLIFIWTDSRGELLDCSIFPFGGISSRQDTKVLQNLFVQVLQHSCHILSTSSSDSGSRLRDIIITRIGCYFELECQEWQKAIYSFGGNDVKKWSLQLRRAMPDGILSSNNGSSLEQQEMGLIQERALPSSQSSLYNPQVKSTFIKGSLGQTNAKKQILAGQAGLDSSRGLLQLARSISFVSVSIDHTLHLILPSDFSSSVGQNSSSSSSASLSSSYIEGFSAVKSHGGSMMPSSYLLIPCPSMRFLPPAPLQLPTCLTSESPPLAHLLHSKGSAIPQLTGFVVSKSIPIQRKSIVEPTREDFPSILSVSLIDHYGGNNSGQEKSISRGSGSSIGAAANKQGRGGMGSAEAFSRDYYEMEAHTVLESIAAELHSLSWMTVSPLYSERRSALPFHCDILLRLRRLLYYADREFSRDQSESTNDTY